MKIEDTVAFVTGASRGLGRALVEGLLQRGARKVYASVRNLDSGVQDRRVIPVILDVTVPEQAQLVAEQCPDVRLLINNAGSLSGYSVLQGDPEQLRRDLDVNFYGTLNVTRAFVPVLESSGGVALADGSTPQRLADLGGAAIVNILSIVAMASMPMIGGYSASKAAAWSLTQSLRGELRGKGIRVLAAFPGPIDTDMARGFEMPKASPEAVANAILEGVASDREDIATDPTSEDVVETFLRDPRELERRFAG